MEAKATKQENQQNRKKPRWLKWVIRLILAYVLLLAVILSVTIIILLGTFIVVIIDTFSDSSGLSEFIDTNLVPLTNALWNLFTWLIPGL
ncbi:hypothetical protein [Alkalicoccobacillus murimartini]|uniref:Uncharacterized protein YqhQ n=1 Tax=Alkalicoccobacillus murimartini TaxID=171685 RepID=A0ABT9YDR5_9BACI|nr:hypothetical protein [Alkalicoccobacillus murimartini]MDQ0205988.1 uncharacterized protein YqhQ [Alkalicoccobacillus murimartini]